MTAAPLVLAAALVAWGPVNPGPPEPAEPGETAGEAAPASAPDEAATAAPAPAGEPPAAAMPVPIQPAIIAKAPIVVRTTPAPLIAPVRAKERTDLRKAKWFWLIAGGMLVSAIVVTVVATRPGPQPYGGNTPPYVVSFP